MTKFFTSKSRLYIISIFSLYFIGCASTTTVQHNSDKGTLSLFSHTDPASNDKSIESDVVTQDVIKSLKEKIAKNPKDVESAISLANIYIALSNTKESIKYAKRALRFDLKEHRARLILAQNYYRQKNYKLAEVVLSSLPPKYNHDAEIINMRALIAYNRNRRGDSWSLFDIGTKKNPTNVALAMNYGVLLLKHRQTDLAKIHFDRVVKLVPNHTDAKVHLAIIAATNGDFEEAEDTINSLTKPDNRVNKFNIGMIAYSIKDYNTAELKLKEFMADKSADKKSLESASIVLEKIARDREKASEEKLAKQENELKSKIDNDKIKKDEKIDELEKELTE